MKVRTTYGSLWAISVPIMFAGVSETIIDVTDAIFLGHYGITELGAVALADAIYLLVVVVTAGLSQPSSTRLLGDRLGAATERHLRDAGIAARVTSV